MLVAVDYSFGSRLSNGAIFEGRAPIKPSGSVIAGLEDEVVGLAFGIRFSFHAANGCHRSRCSLNKRGCRWGALGH